MEYTIEHYYIMIIMKSKVWVFWINISHCCKAWDRKSRVIQ